MQKGTNSPADFHDILRENDNPKNPVPPVIERRFVGENEESNSGNHSIEIREPGNDDVNEIIPIETRTGNDDIITLDQ